TFIEAQLPASATTGPVVVTNSAGQKSNSLTYTVTSSTQATIGYLTPTSGPIGQSVTISGSNFGSTQGASTVKFSGISATASSWSATSITATVPNGAFTGNVVVTVGGVASNGAIFQVTTAGPSISSVSPTSATVGSIITIDGVAFGNTQGTSTVTL